ncbi:hypothetical protein LCGC14_0405600 [marine sediment metagenome]|uniref:Uncharacterized protein n=1 Tax=marine sediment metagenome TaxID=412755 RepID=A0A0F9VHK5_9ZZZZ|nr:hypothetical protein [archaeon]
MSDNKEKLNDREKLFILESITRFYNSLGNPNKEAQNIFDSLNTKLRTENIEKLIQDSAPTTQFLLG